MARVKLDLPEAVVFETEMPLRIGDINYGGHLGNDSVLSLIHEARVRFLKSHGFSELDVGGVGILLSDAVIVYRSEAFYGETLVVSLGVGDFTRVGCDIFYCLSDRIANREVARAKTGIVFFDYKNRKTAAVPVAFKTLFEVT
ncbi:MAG: thioesterase family protein [bacterium]|nr:thioesterase family protein [bacterium]